MGMHWRNTKAELDAIASLATGDAGIVMGPPVNFYKHNGTQWALMKTSSSINWRGEWNSADSYVADDIVGKDGASYLCIAANTNKNPAAETSYWGTLAASAFGTPGSPGAGVPVGGTVGQSLRKASVTDYDTVFTEQIVPYTGELPSPAGLLDGTLAVKYTA